MSVLHIYPLFHGLGRYGIIPCSCDVAHSTIMITGPAGVETKAATYAMKDRVNVSNDTDIRWLLRCVFCA